jgi:hypothetical protein
LKGVTYYAQASFILGQPHRHPLLPLRFTVCQTCLFMRYDSRAIDEYSGTSYEHRRAWIEDKVLWLSSVFAIGICAYALTSNHVHLVLCVDKDKAMSWSDKQVVDR